VVGGAGGLGPAVDDTVLLTVGCGDLVADAAATTGGSAGFVGVCPLLDASVTVTGGGGFCMTTPLAVGSLEAAGGAVVLLGGDLLADTPSPCP